MRRYTFEVLSITTKLVLPIEIYTKMLCYARASKGEIGGWGRTEARKKIVDGIEENHVYVTDIKIFEQPITEVETKLTTDALTKFYLGTPDNERRYWNLWWHSHHDFDVFFSSTDIASIEILTNKKHRPKYYAICINKDGDLIGHQDIYRELDEHVKVIVDYPISSTMMRQCQKEVKQKVIYKEPRVRTPIKLHTSKRLSIFEKAILG